MINTLSSFGILHTLFSSGIWCDEEETLGFVSENSASESLYEGISGAWNGLVRLWTWTMGADARLRFGPSSAILAGGELCFAAEETALDGFV